MNRKKDIHPSIIAAMNGQQYEAIETKVTTDDGDTLEVVRFTFGDKEPTLVDAIKVIIDVELKGLYKRLGDMGFSILLSDAAKQFVAEKGYDVQYGARPLKRAIQTYIEDGISELIVNGDLSKGSVIRVDKEEGKEELNFNTEEQYES